MTYLTKKVTRRTQNVIRDRGKRRELVITLYPGGIIGLRPAKTRREEILTVEAAFDLAVKQRVARERVDRLKIKKAKKTK